MKIIGINNCTRCISKLKSPKYFEFYGTKEQCIEYLEKKGERFIGLIKAGTTCTKITIDECVQLYEGFESALKFLKKEK